ncbi:MAG: S-methyl-5-thioribose-1-phosphate isomerase [Gemmatimonadales bacterium]|nr:S-methyl-5-thioribose-1-phosphate isomerase [Gemmatimonadales bacterium]
MTPPLPFRPVAWTPLGGVRALDQTRLPDEERWLDLDTLDGVADAIRSLRVRGAPLIGIVAAMGLAGEVARAARGGVAGAALRERLDAAAALLAATRPTAVNLRWALDRLLTRAAATPDNGLADALRAEAQAIWDEDLAMGAAIGAAGLDLVPDGALVLTHCNAGALATGGMGTALAPVYAARAAGRTVRVIADETRPLLQGSRLTAWELARAGIDVTVITDGMAASRLARGDVACVLVGADRVAANGDVANKIGTYGVALAARAAGVPFVVALPASTIDPATPNGAAIPIEERHAAEIAAAPGARVWNPAFDVTPASLVTAYLTDRGRIAPADWPAFVAALCGAPAPAATG